MSKMIKDQRYSDFLLSELVKDDEVKDDEVKEDESEKQKQVKDEEQQQPAAIVRISPSMRPVLQRVSSSPSQGDSTWGLRRRLLLDESRLQVISYLLPPSSLPGDARVSSCSSSGVAGGGGRRPGDYCSRSSGRDYFHFAAAGRDPGACRPHAGQPGGGHLAGGQEVHCVHVAGGGRREAHLIVSREL